MKGYKYSNNDMYVREGAEWAPLSHYFFLSLYSHNRTKIFFFQKKKIED